jgi:magnesium-transporting ATPase (P-type)
MRRTIHEKLREMKAFCCYDLMMEKKRKKLFLKRWFSNFATGYLLSILSIWATYVLMNLSALTKNKVLMSEIGFAEAYYCVGVNGHSFFGYADVSEWGTSIIRIFLSLGILTPFSSSLKITFFFMIVILCLSLFFTLRAYKHSFKDKYKSQFWAYFFVFVLMIWGGGVLSMSTSCYPGKRIFSITDF